MYLIKYLTDISEIVNIKYTFIIITIYIYIFNEFLL